MSKKEDIPFKEQLTKLTNFLKKRKFRYQYEHALDGYEPKDYASFSEYECLCMLMILTADNINEKIKITPQMKATALLENKESDFIAFYNKIKRKKSIFSSKIRNKRKTLRNNEPLSDVSKHKQEIKGAESGQN